MNIGKLPLAKNMRFDMSQFDDTATQERRNNMYVIRGKSGYKFFSTEPATFSQEVKHETYKQAESVLKQAKEALPFEEFEIVEV